MTPSISVCSLRRRYRDHLALEDVSFEIEGPSITGLLGRNGAGKSTLMRVLAAQERPTSGTVRVLGGPVWENGNVLRNIVLVREDQEYPDMQVGQIIRAASWFHRNWCDDLAAEMLDQFELPLRRPVKKLSRGMRSALGIVIGLAARAEVTLLDEPYAGLDAVARRMFYDRLLADYAVHPRTVVLSTHLIDEAADLMEHVILVDHGRIIVDAPADDVRGGATTVTGPAQIVDRFVADRPTWERRRLGTRQSVIMAGALDDVDSARAREMHLDLHALSLQEIVVHAAGRALGHGINTREETSA
jgi:ABC-2 type transport system ATP-binding protein